MANEHEATTLNTLHQPSNNKTQFVTAPQKIKAREHALESLQHYDPAIMTPSPKVAIFQNSSHDHMLTLLTRQKLLTTVFKARTVDATRRVLNTERPTLMILELDLDDGDGATVLEKIATQGKDGPAIVLLSRDVTRMIHLTTDHSMPYLAQPFDIDVATETFHATLELRLRPLPARQQ